MYITSHNLKGIITAIDDQLPSIMSGILAIHNTTLTKEDIPPDTTQQSSRDQDLTEHLITELHTEDQVAIMDLSEEDIMDHTEEAIMDHTEVHMDRTEEGHQVLSEELMVHTEEAQASAEAQEVQQATEGDPLADLEDHTEYNKQAR